MYTSLVAMFCGPHDNDGGISYRRIDAAIERARKTRAKQLPIVICGDGNGGQDCLQFIDRAQQGDIQHAFFRYHAGASTITDAQSLALVLSRDPTFAHVREVHLVTDWWHMPRATLFLQDTLRACIARRSLRVIEHPVMCQVPPTHVLAREEQGIQDFLAGTYGTNPPAESYGKPLHLHSKNSITSAT